ncbi:MAG: sigma-70 family RNA polymerase sigma factor, partial [Planctomycetota bacterium]
MTTTREDPTAAGLLAHRDFLRALARRLVHDADDADDIAQEAMVVALEKPPPSGANRAWLSGVTRKLALRHHRSRRRRAAREATRARADRVDATVDDVARLETQRRVVEAVVALPPMDRDVIVARFLDGKPPRVVARELGVPVETVRSRTRRALARLRKDLDARTPGGRRVWCAALLPLLAGRSVLAAGVATVLLMATVGVVAVQWSAPPTTPPQRAALENPVEPEPGDAVPAAEREPEATPGDREPARRRLRHTVNLETPGARLRVQFRHFGADPDPEPLELVADAEGIVTFDPPTHPHPAHHVDLLARAEGRAWIRRRIEGDALQKPRWQIFFGRAGVVRRGRIVDPEGRPIEGAEVSNGTRDRTEADGRFES